MHLGRLALPGGLFTSATIEHYTGIDETYIQTSMLKDSHKLGPLVRIDSATQYRQISSLPVE